MLAPRDMRAVPIVVVVIFALAACGGSTVSVGDSAADGGGGGSSGGNDGSCPETVGPYCPWNGCLDGPRATCSHGAWVCPPPPSGCSEQCSGQPSPDCKCGTPTCHFGTWECPGSCDADAGSDATADADASATFPCGGLLVCHPASEYCKVGVGGPAGAQPSYSCEAIPAACATNIACACIKPAVGGQICSDEPGVTVTFEYP